MIISVLIKPRWVISFYEGWRNPYTVIIGRWEKKWLFHLTEFYVCKRKSNKVCLCFSCQGLNLNVYAYFRWQKRTMTFLFWLITTHNQQKSIYPYITKIFFFSIYLWTPKTICSLIFFFFYSNFVLIQIEYPAKKRGFCEEQMEKRKVFRSVYVCVYIYMLVHQQ